MVRSVKQKTGGGRAAQAVIEILEDGARVAVMTRRKGRPVVADLIEVEFPAAGEGESVSVAAKGQALREALRTRRWSLGGATLLLPKNIVTLRLATLPSEDDDELAEMARFEAQKHIPFNVERHVIAHAVLSKEGVEGSRALVAAVDQAALEQPLSICREAKIEVTTARVSSLALVEALQLEPPAGQQDITCALVNVGWSTVDITIMSRGIVRFTRSGSLGVTRIADQCKAVLGPGAKLTRDHLVAIDALEPEGFFKRQGRPQARPKQSAPSFVVDDFAEEPLEDQAGDETPEIDLTGAGGSGQVPTPEATGPAGEILKWLDRLLQEIGRTRTFAAREFDCQDLDAVYITGVGAYIANLDAYLKPRLRCPVVVIPPPGTVEFATTEAGDLRGAWSEFAVAIGAAAGDALPPVDLLPPEYAERLQKRRRLRSLAVAGTLVFILIGVSTAFGVRWVMDQRNLLGEYQRINRELLPRVTSLRDMETRLGLVEEIVEDDLSSSSVLKAITSIPMLNDITIPSDNPSTIPQVRTRRVTLLDYHYYKGEGITLEGHALNNTDVVNFVGELENLGIFSLVSEKNRSTARLSRRPNVVRFTLECRFRETE